MDRGAYIPTAPDILPKSAHGRRGRTTTRQESHTMDKSYTIVGVDTEELEYAADRVDEYMSEGTGRNAIYYQIIGDKAPLPYDVGFVSDMALTELMLEFVIVEN